jgi:putative ABC transport system permease protein
MLRDLGADFLHAGRRLRRNPRTSIFAIAVLAAGIGLAAAVFSVAYAFLLAPLPFADANRLVFVALLNARQVGGFGVVDARDWQAGAAAFESIALSTYEEYIWTGQSLSAFEGSEVLRGLSVSDNYFTTLRGPMALGRGFAPGEGSPDVVVIGYGLWQRRFGGREDVLGRTVKLNGQDFRIVGVAGPDFRTYDVAPFSPMMYSYEVQAWTPFPMTGGQRGNHMGYAVGRLKAGVTLAAARTQVEALQARLASQYRENEGMTPQIIPLGETVARRVRPAVGLLLAAVLCLVLIAASNVAGLLLARAAGQGREMAIRIALGADRRRIFRMVFAEAGALALLSGLSGALVAWWALAGLNALVPASFRLGWAFDYRPLTLGAALIVSFASALLASLAPAIASVRAGFAGIAASASPARSRLLQGIVMAEIALAVALTISAGLCTKAFAGLLHTGLGYRTDNLLAMRVRVQEQRYFELANRVNYWDELVSRVRGLPGVEIVSAASGLPMGHTYSGGTFWVQDQPLPQNGQRPRANRRSAMPGYFAALGIPLLEGRDFTRGDDAGSEPSRLSTIFSRGSSGPTAAPSANTCEPPGPFASWAWPDAFATPARLTATSSKSIVPTARNCRN